ncbi:hypothetical protein FD755_011238 [Muntiacus reevesi]|uniref:C2 domain-containing protein n=1 Tax=Muntiacus reevesi TaxID=9886 RepID=A0A5N3XW14_MUNRE|nr:hypothetical protein FD755_011238 [Muntiacus reevesi]
MGRGQQREAHGTAGWLGSFRSKTASPPRSTPRASPAAPRPGLAPQLWGPLPAGLTPPPRAGGSPGLGSARCDRTAPVQPEVGDVASGPGGAQQWGRLQLSLECDSGSQEIRVGLQQAAELRPGVPGCRADPCAHLSLSPDAGRTHETRVHRGTLCPVFEETCSFHVPPGAARTALRVLLLGHRRLSQHRPRGALILPLGSVDLQHVLELWRPLGPPAPGSHRGTVLLTALRAGSGRLTVVVLEARDLSPALADPYVKVQPMLNQRKWKKRKMLARKGTAAPHFSEAFTFLVPFSQIQLTSVFLPLPLHLCLLPPRAWIWCWPWAEPVGKALLGSRASGQPLQHWADKLARRPVAQWRRLQPAREMDLALALQSRRRLPLPGF